jgi:aspartate dehydrogenase
MLRVALIGFGAIGQALFKRAQALPNVQICEVIVRAGQVSAAQLMLGKDAVACEYIGEQNDLVIECAGHQAITEHALAALERGIPTAVLSIGALCEEGLPEMLADAAQRGGTRVHLLAGAIGAVDALAAAKMSGLDQVTYTGRKPPLAWRGTPAEGKFDLANLHTETVLLEATAREAARQYPKNANVAATIGLAGLGLDQTIVRLIADPKVSENIHEVTAQGAFGSFRIEMRNRPLAENPKTSELTVLSALRFLRNQSEPLSI